MQTTSPWNEHKVVQDKDLPPTVRNFGGSYMPPMGSIAKKRSKNSKLIPTLNDKQNYVLHYRNLQLYVSLGMKVTKVHRILEFKQEPWLRTYIDFNSDRRKHAKNDFEKDFFLS